MAVQIIKRRTKAIMMDTMLGIDRWPQAVDYAVHTHNLVPITRKTQHDGSGIPPLVELSNAHSRSEPKRACTVLYRSKRYCLLCEE
eukprot:COSAG01_NODE_5657_length_4114_cov_58.182565_1_plen_86_part_00